MAGKQSSQTLAAGKTMFILLNGSFGIGKTTTAKALVAERASSSIFDPEPLGIAMQRLSAYLRPAGRIDDFQDFASWRYLTAQAAQWQNRRFDIVVVPMAFSNLSYFEELAGRLSRSAVVHKLCLVAPLEVVCERLQRRAEAEGKAVDDWALRRAADCCRAHVSPAFGRPIDATMPTGDILRAVAASTSNESLTVGIGS